MKYIVNLRTTSDEQFEVDAKSEQEAVALVHDMFYEGELDNDDRVWYDLEFTCGSARETDSIQSLI